MTERQGRNNNMVKKPQLLEIETRKRLDRARVFAFCGPSRDEVELRHMEQEDGSVLWAILRWGSAWTRQGRWEQQSMPSSRTVAFLKRARWTFDEAWAECERIEREMGFGLPAEEVLRRCRSSVEAKKWKSTDKGHEVVYRPTRKNARQDVWIAFPVGDDWSPDELRRMASRAAEWCRMLKIAVDLVSPVPAE